MKKSIIAVMALAAILAGCKSNNTTTKAEAEPSSQHEGHEGHDHEGHEHEGEEEEFSNMSSCSGHDHAHGAEAKAEKKTADAHAGGDEIIFPAKQAALVDFAVEQINPSTFSEVIKCSGEILSAQGDVATVTAPVSGIVSLSGVKLSEGSSVSSRTPLFHISSKGVASGDLFTKVATQYRQAKADFERAEALVGEKIVSQKEYQQAKTTYEQAKAEYSALSDKQSAKGTSVSAPISGYVTSLNVSQGDFVEVGAPLATISQNKRLKLRAELSQRYSSKIGSIRSANFRSLEGDKVYSLAQMNGKLLSAGRSAESGSTLIPVTFEFDNRDNIIQGVFVEVYLVGTPMADALTVPVSAITEQQGLLYVYVQLDEEGYTRREVTVGGSDGQRVQILSGIKAGDRVVTKGAVNVKMAASSGAIPAGHSH